MGRIACIAVASALTGCAVAPNLHQTGRTVPKGDLRLASAAGMGASTQALELFEDLTDAAKTLDAAKTPCQASDGSAAQCVDAALYEPLVETALVAGLFPPVTPHTEIALRYGVWEGLDAGLRLTPVSWRLDGRYQLLGADDPAASLTATVGLGWTSVSAAVPGVLEKLDLDGSGRQDLDIPLVVGWHPSKWFSVAVGARYMVTFWQLDLQPQVPILGDTPAGGQITEAIVGVLPATDSEGTASLIGGMVGLWLGPVTSRVGVELTVTRYSMEAELLGERRSFDGAVIYPTVGGHLQF